MARGVKAIGRWIPGVADCASLNRSCPYEDVYIHGPMPLHWRADPVIRKAIPHVTAGPVGTSRDRNDESAILRSAGDIVMRKCEIARYSLDKRDGPRSFLADQRVRCIE